MQNKVRSFIQSNKLLQGLNKPVIVGVSGGSDSVALLNILIELGYKCHIAHCNFHLRGPESDRDFHFVKSLAVTLDLPFSCVDFDTKSHASIHNISIEMAARELRYNWFTELFTKHHAQAIAVGHHLDDNIETILLNFVRGTGLKGLTGIPARNGHVIRPILSCTKLEIDTYIEHNKLEYIEDSSNFSTDILRNKFRHDIIPALETINPAFKQTMTDTHKHLQSAYNIYKEKITTLSNDLCIRTMNQTKISIEKLSTQQEKETLLFEILRPFRFNPDQVKQIIQSLHATPGKLFYSATHVLVKDRDFLVIQPINNQNKTAHTPIEISGLSRFEIRIFPKEKDFVISTSHELIHLDAGKITFPLTYRTWEEADTFYPLGMQNKKKVSDFLIDEKINRLEKEKVTVLQSGNAIVWVIGKRIDDRFKITPSTRQVLEIKLVN